MKLPSIAAIVALSTAVAVQAADRAPTAEFTAVRTATAPKIDGKIEPGEWDGALTSSGLMAAFSYTQVSAPTEMSMTFDDERLYFLFRCTRASGEWKLTKSVRTNDGYSYGDPSIEIWVSPPKAIPETYQNVINTYPAVLDNHMIPSRGYTAQGWTGNWELGVSEDDDQYIIEASIPIADFGMPGIRDNDVWQFLLCRSAHGAWPRAQGSWSITTSFAEIPQHPPVRLAFDDVAVQVRGMHTLLSGQYKIPVTLVAPRDSDATVTIVKRLHQAPVPGGAGDLVETETIELQAGSRRQIEYAGAVPQEWKKKISIGRESQELPAGHLTIRVTRDDKTLYAQTIPYVSIGYVPSRPTRPANQAELPPVRVTAQYGPQSNTLLVRTDILDLPQRDAVQGGYVRLLDADDDLKELKRFDLAPFIEFYSDSHQPLEDLEIPLQDHSAQDQIYAEIKRIKEENKDRAAARKAAASRKPKAGEERVDPDADPALKPLPVPEEPQWTAPRNVVAEVTVTDASGQPLHSAHTDAKLLRHHFTWQNNTLGISDKVIPPWTPVEVTDNTFGVWNRQLTVDGLAMLQSADNGGTQQIQAMRLVAVKDGQSVVIQGGQPAIQKQTEAAVTFTGEGTGAGLHLAATSTLEMDGFVLTDLTIAPQDNEAAVDKLYLEVILPESEATHFATTAGGWAAVHDETPAYWSSQKTGSGVLIGDFVPYIWLTNSDRGFLWIADNDKGWITEPDRKHPTQEIVRENGTVTLRIHFIEVPTTLSAPTSLRYAYQNFPARPLPGGWRSWVCSNYPIDGAPSARHTFFFPELTAADWVINWPYYGSPFPHSWERSKRFWDRAASRPDHRPTVGSIAHSIGFYRDYEGRAFPEFSVDWGENPGQLVNNDVTQSRGPIDFRVYYYDQWIRRSGLRMLYIDETYISYDRNFLTGGAYYRPDGRLQPGYTYLGLRDYFKRMTYAMRDAGAAKPNLWMHVSSGAAYHAWWADVFMEGENVAPTDEQFDYLEVLPAARMRAIGSARAAGGAMLMMCQAQRHRTAYVAKHVHQFVGWVLAHDILPEQVHWFQPIAEAAQFHRDDVEFVGYWHDHVPVKATTANCVVSLHKVPGRAILWIVNTAREDQAVDVAIDWKKLGLDRSRVQAVNAETGVVVPLTDAGLQVDVLKRDFVAVHLVERPAGAGAVSFRASFEQSPEADFALGATPITGGSGLVKGKKGKGLGIGKDVTFAPHLNLTNDQGRLHFAAQFTGKPGIVVRNVFRGARKDEPPLPPGFVLEIKSGHDGNPAQLILRTNEKDGPQVTTTAPPAGWHDVTLSWDKGQMRVSIDNTDAGAALPLATLNICDQPGHLENSARLVFGENAAAITAIDELVAERSF